MTSLSPSSDTKPARVKISAPCRPTTDFDSVKDTLPIPTNINVRKVFSDNLDQTHSPLNSPVTMDPEPFTKNYDQSGDETVSQSSTPEVRAFTSTSLPQVSTDTTPKLTTTTQGEEAKLTPTTLSSTSLLNDKVDIPDSTSELKPEVSTKKGSAHVNKNKEKKENTPRSTTLLSGSRVRHLKKKDSEPFWRFDIQYDFLRGIFDNDQRAFRNSYPTDSGVLRHEPADVCYEAKVKQEGSTVSKSTSDSSTDTTDGQDSNKDHDSETLYTFADIYIDAMARSSKCSKILRLKLQERSAAVNMAMVCLLVNIGRMNTTLNFFPEMKAQLRTYHPIPSLQAGNDENDYKQLQDAPRLKSILKGACEDRPEPQTLDEMVANDRVPHTNPVNLLFLMSTYSQTVSKLLFPADYDIFDLIMNQELSSESRSRAFLWLVWSYLETDLSEEQLRKNPFIDPFAHTIPNYDYMKIPPLVKLTPVQLMLENVDTDHEKEYAKRMKLERKRYLQQVSETPGVSAVGAIPNRIKLKVKEFASNDASRLIPNGDMHDDIDSSAGKQSIRELRKNSRVNYADLAVLGDLYIDDERVGLANGKKGIKRSSNGKTKELLVDGRRTAPLVATRELKIVQEIEYMIFKRGRRARRERYKSSSIKREWEKIKNRDPLYLTDDEKIEEDEMNLSTLMAVYGKHNTTAGANGIVSNATDTNTNSTDAKPRKKRKALVSAAAQTSATTSATPASQSAMPSTGVDMIDKDTASLVEQQLPINRNSGNTTTQLPSEEKLSTMFNIEDFGEETFAMRTAFRRANRWLSRWENGIDNGHKNTKNVEETSNDNEVNNHHETNEIIETGETSELNDVNGIYDSNSRLFIKVNDDNTSSLSGLEKEKEKTNGGVNSDPIEFRDEVNSSLVKIGSSDTTDQAADSKLHSSEETGKMVIDKSNGDTSLVALDSMETTDGVIANKTEDSLENVIVGTQTVNPVIAEDTIMDTDCADENNELYETHGKSWQDE